MANSKAKQMGDSRDPASLKTDQGSPIMAQSTGQAAMTEKRPVSTENDKEEAGDDAT